MVKAYLRYIYDDSLGQVSSSNGNLIYYGSFD